MTDGGDIDLTVIIPDTPTLGDAIGATGTSLITDGTGPTLAIRTLKSSDASVTVATSGSGDIDLTATIPPATTLSATQTGFVTVGSNPNYSLSVGPITGTTQSLALTNKTTAYNSSTYCTFVGVNAGTNHSAGLLACTCVGSNAGSSLTTGYANTFIGTKAGASCTSQTNNTYVGASCGEYGSTNNTSNTCVGLNSFRFRTNSTTNSCLGTAAGDSALSSTINEMCALGAFAGYDTTGSQGVFIGTNAGCNLGITNTGVIAIGYQCCFVGGAGAQAGTNSVHIGANCACDNTAGRLNFGNSMEAPHNSFPVPAANPQKYLKIKWNGVLYYIPAYTTTPT